jgi:hypothetical protein
MRVRARRSPAAAPRRRDRHRDRAAGSAAGRTARHACHARPGLPRSAALDLVPSVGEYSAKFCRRAYSSSSGQVWRRSVKPAAQPTLVRTQHLRHNTDDSLNPPPENPAVWPRRRPSGPAPRYRSIHAARPGRTRPHPGGLSAARGVVRAGSWRRPQGDHRRPGRVNPRIGQAVDAVATARCELAAEFVEDCAASTPGSARPGRSSPSPCRRPGPA